MVLNFAGWDPVAIGLTWEQNRLNVNTHGYDKKESLTCVSTSRNVALSWLFSLKGAGRQNSTRVRHYYVEIFLIFSSCLLLYLGSGINQSKASPAPFPCLCNLVRQTFPLCSGIQQDSLYDMCHEKTDLKVFVVVIPKEGWAWPRAPIFLLVWQWQRP